MDHLRKNWVTSLQIILFSIGGPQGTRIVQGSPIFNHPLYSTVESFSLKPPKIIRPLRLPPIWRHEITMGSGRFYFSTLKVGICPARGIPSLDGGTKRAIAAIGDRSPRHGQRQWVMVPWFRCHQTEQLGNPRPTQKLMIVPAMDLHFHGFSRIYPSPNVNFSARIRLGFELHTHEECPCKPLEILIEGPKTLSS